MSEPAAELERDDVFQETATVRGVDDATFAVEAATHRGVAKRAASCLVRPTEGDRVLLATSRTGQAWILAVLDRALPETALPVEADGDLRLGARRVQLRGDEGVNVTTAGDVTVTAGELGVRSLRAHLAVESVQVAGAVLVSQIDRVKRLAKTIDEVAERFSQRVQRSFRTVEDIERLRAGHVDHVADATYSVRSDHTVMTSERLVKVDGKQVHIG